MISPLSANLLPLTTLGLAAAPVNRPPIPTGIADSFEAVSVPQQTLTELTRPHATALSPASEVSEEPDGTARLSAALFVGTTQLSDPAAQASLISLNALATFFHEIDTAKLAFVLAFFSITITRIAFRNILFPLFRKLGINSNKARDTDVKPLMEVDEADLQSSWNPWPPPVSSAPPKVVNGQRLPPPAEAINNATAFIARGLEPFQKPFLVLPFAALSASLQLYSDVSSPLAAYVPEALAIGLAYYTKRYRNRVIDSPMILYLARNNLLLTAPAWRFHQRRPLGVFGPNVARNYSPEECYQIGHKYYSGEPTPSTWRPLRAAFEIIGFSTKYVQQIRYSVSRQKYNEEIRDFVENGNIQPVDPAIMPVGSVLVRQWVISDADRKCANLEIKNEGAFDTTEPGSNVITYGKHKSIWSDFWLLFLLETYRRHIRMVADIRFFATAPWFRKWYSKLGTRNVAYAWMKLGLIYVSRGKTKTTHDWLQDCLDKMELGIWPHFFPGGTREDQTFHKDGRPDTSGILSTVANPDVPEHILRIGMIDAAMWLAYRSGKPTMLFFIDQEGSERIAPKEPGLVKTYIQENTLNQDVTATIGDKIVVELDQETREIMSRLEHAQDKAEIDRLKKRLQEKRQAYLEIVIEKWLQNTREPELIRERYAEWVRADRPEQADELSRRFNERSSRDRRYLQIAGRIRAIRPQYRERRQQFEDRLHELVASDAPSDEAIAALNRDVAYREKKPWYRSLFS